MYQLVETIKCHNGELINFAYHQSRFNLTRRALFRDCSKILLSEAISIPKNCTSGLFKCRVLYSQNIEKIEFVPYQYRTIKSLKLVHGNHIDYRYKYTSRKNLELLFDQRGTCDDILIVRNGFISDSFIANVIFFDGVKWWTPDTPLLPGIQRARLIYEKKIGICSITPADLSKYSLAGLINAMQDMNHMPRININQIYW